MRSIATLLMLLLAASAASAQEIEFGSSLNPVGSGARAMGMGGAFIAVADDATAASWNPAGLVQLEKPEISVVYSLFGRHQQYHSETHPEMNTSNSMDAVGLNYASVAFPFVALNRNMVVSLNYQRLYEMNKHLKFDYTVDTQGRPLYNKVDFRQTGYLYALSPAFAVQLLPNLYIGGTLNIWDNYLGRNSWTTAYKSTAVGSLGTGQKFTMEMDRTQDFSFKGINGNLGVLWNLYGPFTLGAVYKSAFHADVRRHAQETVTLASVSSPSWKSTNYAELHDDHTMSVPRSYGIGMSYRHSDAWTVALDAYRTEWSHFWMTDREGKKVNPLTSLSLSEGRPTDTTQVRIGTEYLFVRDKYVVPVRFGLFYDPEPGTESPDDYYGFSLGTGYAGGKIAFDIAYQFRMGNKVESDVTGISKTTADVRQHSLLVSLIYYFDK